MNPTPETVTVAPQPKVWRVAVVGVVVIVLLVAAYFAVPPAYRSFKRWRSQRLAHRAEELMRENQWGKAGEKAEAAFMLARNEPAALRAMAKTLTHATNAAALQFWQQLILIGQASDSERRDYIELALRNGSLNVAAEEVRRLLVDGPNEPLNLWLAAQVFAALGDRSQTLYYATRAQMHDPANSRYHLFVASLLFDSQAAPKQAEARSNIWGLAHQPNQIGLEALGFLGQRQDLREEERRELIALLKKNPLSGTAQQLEALDQAMRIEPKRRPEILDRAMTEYRGAEPSVLNPFVVWLNQHEEFQRTLDVLPLESALKRKELFIPHMDALAALGRWKQLEDILDTKRTPLEEVYAEGFRARCAMQLNKGPTAAVHWRKALFYAERNPEQLTWLARYAEKCGDADQAKKTWRSLISCVNDPRPAYLALEELTEKTGTTEELRQLLSEMVKRWPKDPGLRNDFAYLNLLLGEAVAESRQVARELLDEFPESLPHRTTLALAYLRSKDSSAALRLYEGRQYDWNLALPGDRAVYAAVLEAGGKQAEAREQAMAIPRDRLREQELELIRPLAALR